MATEIGKNEPKDIKNGGFALSQVSPNWGASRLYQFLHLMNLPENRKTNNPFRNPQAAMRSLIGSTVRITDEQPRTQAAEHGARDIPPCTIAKIRAPFFFLKALLHPAGSTSTPGLSRALPVTEETGGRIYIILPAIIFFHFFMKLVWFLGSGHFSNSTKGFGDEQPV